jgi:hypothetical protein
LRIWGASEAATSRAGEDALTELFFRAGGRTAFLGADFLAAFLAVFFLAGAGFFLAAFFFAGEDLFFAPFFRAGADLFFAAFFFADFFRAAFFAGLFLTAFFFTAGLFLAAFFFAAFFRGTVLPLAVFLRADLAGEDRLALRPLADFFFVAILLFLQLTEGGRGGLMKLQQINLQINGVSENSLSHKGTKCFARTKRTKEQPGVGSGYLNIRAGLVAH